MAKKTKSDADRLRVVHKLDVPLQEVSGICLRRDGAGGMAIIAVGDRAATVAWSPFCGRNAEAGDWRTVDLSHVPGSRLPAKDPQIEAVCADGAGRVLLLQEVPPRAELFDAAPPRVVGSVTLSVQEPAELARAWGDPDGSHGEGAVLFANGNLLIAKEKDPAVLIEFGPAGARSHGLAHGGTLPEGTRWPIEPGDHAFVALAVWSPEKRLRKACADFSDLEIGPDGRLYVLSDQSASIARLAELPPGGGIATADAVWKLEDLNGKPEGLTFDSRGRAIVALDKRKKRNNVVVLEPQIAPHS